MDEPLNCTEFEWDEGNRGKNWAKHGVHDTEAEQVFFNRPLVVDEDRLHSETELRHHALGRTSAGRRLFVAYTIRGTRVRVISARDMVPAERREYERATAKALETDPEV